MTIELKIRSLDVPQVRSIHRERMVRDFPENELKPLNMIERALREKRYRCYGGFEGERLAAYAFFVTIRMEDRAVWLFDYLAVDEEHRDQGVGSAFLQALSREVLPEAETVLLEIDDPDFAEGEERERRLRRAVFYQLNGLIDTGVTALVFGARFRILEVSVRERHSRDTCLKDYEGIYHSLLPDSIYRRNVSIA